LEAEQLHRIADLAVAVLACLRGADRGRYDSERTLRGWLQADGVEFTTADIPPALALLETKGLLVRVEAQLGLPRPGWLPGEADSPEVLPPQIAKARLVVEVCRPDQPGRGSRSTAAEIAERLALVDADIPAGELAEILERLVDCGRLVQVRKGDAAPITYAVAMGRFDAPDFDEVDLLVSEMCRVLRDHDEGFSDEDQLRGWLADAGVTFDDRQFEQAIGIMMHLGRLQVPRADSWQGPGPRPTWLVPAPIHTG